MKVELTLVRFWVIDASLIPGWVAFCEHHKITVGDTFKVITLSTIIDPQ